MDHVALTQGKLHFLGADFLTIKLVVGYMPRYMPKKLGSDGLATDRLAQGPENRPDSGRHSYCV